MRYQMLGGVSRNGEARAELGEGRIEEWLTRWGRTAEAELGAPMATAVLCARGARAREEELAGANGSGDGGGCGQALLVAAQGASKPPHARHAAAELCRLATAARRGRPRAWMRRWRGRGEGVSAGGLGRLRPAGQNRGRGLLAPSFTFSFF